MTFFFSPLISVRSCTDEHLAPAPQGGGRAGAAFVVITFPKRDRTDSGAFPLLPCFSFCQPSMQDFFLGGIKYIQQTHGNPQRPLAAARCSTFPIKLSVAHYLRLADTDKLSWCGQTNRAHMGSDISQVPHAAHLPPTNRSASRVKSTPSVSCPDVPLCQWQTRDCWPPSQKRDHKEDTTSRRSRSPALPIKNNRKLLLSQQRRGWARFSIPADVLHVRRQENACVARNVGIRGCETQLIVGNRWRFFSPILFWTEHKSLQWVMRWLMGKTR